MPKILICGHFANGKQSFDGQTVKTVNLYNELVKKYGDDKIITSDTYFIKRRPLKFIFELKKNLKKVNNVIILPAQRGIKVIVPLLNFFNNHRKFKIHYIVIGAWLASLIESNESLKKSLKKLDYIYIETNKTLKKLVDMGFNNVYQMNNFKNLSVSNKKYATITDRLNCCIFSRVEYLKGINDAIDVVNDINLKSNVKIYLDIYGKIKDGYREEFYKKIAENSYITYKGTVDQNKSVETIENYNLLLFPTLYYTEGIPGTVIDSYFAGVPVLASKWENFAEVIEDGITGIGYEFKNKDEFKKKLCGVLNNDYDLMRMSSSCKKRAKNYSPNSSLTLLYKNLGD